MALIDEYTKDELEQIVKQSLSIKEVIDKLGYKTNSGSNNETVKKRIELYGISTHHFINKPRIPRNYENVFVLNSSATRAIVKRFYKKGNYTEYICSICGQEPFWNGKPMVLILDHINGNCHDNRIDNLRWVCPNCNQQLDTTNGKNKKRNNLAKKYYCIDCGKEISRTAKRCHKCNNKFFQTIPLSEMRLTREELKKSIRKYSFSDIGKEYGVSDNAVKKWCKKYGLPYKKSIINKYPDREWDLI